MKALKIVTSIFLVLLIVLAVLLPIGPVPGVFIGGTESEVPVSWGDTSSIHEIKLKVGAGALPRVVTIWVIQFDEDLYVVGAKDSGWVVKLDAGGSVEMRLEDKTYALSASLVTTNWQPILSAYMDKYRPDYPDIVGDFPAIEEAGESISVFMLSST